MEQTRKSKYFASIFVHYEELIMWDLVSILFPEWRFSYFSYAFLFLPSPFPRRILNVYDRWQTFRKGNKNINNRKSVAPKAPLKKADKLSTGFASWEEERAHEDQVRKDAGHSATGSGYTTFKKKNPAEEAAERKRVKLIESRVRPDDKKYFIPAETFEGWKFNYVYTTKAEHGTGYFWDGMDAIKELKGELARPKKNKIQTVTAGNNDESETQRKKKKRKKNRGPMIISDPNNPREQVQAIIEQRLQAKNGLLSNLPPGWEASIDSASKKPYYYNRATGERSWAKPENKRTVQPNHSEELPQGWKSTTDKSTGKIYYYNDKGETKWEKPTIACS